MQIVDALLGYYIYKFPILGYPFVLPNLATCMIWRFSTSWISLSFSRSSYIHNRSIEPNSGLRSCVISFYFWRNKHTHTRGYYIYKFPILGYPLVLPNLATCMIWRFSTSWISLSFSRSSYLHNRSIEPNSGLRSCVISFFFFFFGETNTHTQGRGK